MKAKNWRWREHRVLDRGWPIVILVAPIGLSLHGYNLGSLSASAESIQDAKCEIGRH
jgi:hypothetical protein